MHPFLSRLPGQAQLDLCLEAIWSDAVDESRELTPPQPSIGVETNS